MITLLGLIPGLLTFLTSTLGNYFAAQANVTIAKTQADRDVQVQAIQAAAAEFAQQQQLAAVRWGWWPYRILVLAAAIPPVWHAGGVFFDSCSYLPWLDFSRGFFHPTFVAHAVGSWTFVAAPGGYADVEFKTLAAIIGFVAVQGGVAAYLHKK